MSIFPYPQIIKVSDKNQLSNNPLIDSLYEGSIIYAQDTGELYVKSNGTFQCFTVGCSDYCNNNKEIKRGQKKRRK